MIKVLFISQWYPHRYDKMFGLFVQKHAQAALLYSQVKVLYVHPDPNIEKIELIETTKAGLTEIIVYYPAKSDSTFHKFYKFMFWLKAYKTGFKHLKQIDFSPDIIHSNILTRTGVIALYQKIFNKIPYVITEHWSRYLPIRNSYKGFFRKMITRIVVKNASDVFPVSKNLKDAMLSFNLKNQNYKVINNVVDDFFFEKPTVVHRTKKRILHVSCFDEKAKNVKGILHAIYELSKKRDDFELILIGTGLDFEEVHHYYETISFPKGIIHFLGERKPEEVANWMHNSDLLMLFSNYENAPVVISESLACGKPVLSSNVGGISEQVNESNGLLINARDEVALIEKMNYMLDHYTEYDTDSIRKYAINQYSYMAVGLKLNDEYKRILKI